METVNFDVINENETDVKIKKLSKAYLVSKRIFDLISSSIALIVLSPIFLIIMVAIKIGSKGRGH
jgi:lipopolysaccharide/colanic/teichoic acid biosynthesis glycosyltransferase